MLISFREAADLGFQLMMAVASVAGGMAIAEVATKPRLMQSTTIDISRPTLWASSPTYVDRQSPLLPITNMSVETASQTAVGTCSDAIGLRIACDLLATGPRRS